MVAATRPTRRGRNIRAICQADGRMAGRSILSSARAILADLPAFGPDLAGRAAAPKVDSTAMGKAYVDPAELRRFAQDLSRFNNELEILVGGLHGRMRNLESTWRDQEQRKFAEAFAQTTKALGSFLEASHQHVVFLGKKAGAIEDYLKQK